MKANAILALASGSTPILPVPTNYGVLTPEQIKAGCTVNMAPPFRPECHAADAGHTVHAGATPTPNTWPDIDVGCSWDGGILPDCHLRIGFRPPEDGPIDDPGDLQLSPGEESTTTSPTPFPDYGPRNWTRYAELSNTNKTGTRRRHRTIPRPYIYTVDPESSSLSPMMSSSGLSSSSGSSTSSFTLTSTPQSNPSTTTWSTLSHVPGFTSSGAHPTISWAYSTADTSSLPAITSPPVIPRSSNTMVSSGATHSSTTATVLSSSITSLPSTASFSNSPDTRSSGTTSSASSSSPRPTASSSHKASSTTVSQQSSISSSATSKEFKTSTAVASKSSTLSKTSSASSLKTSSTSTSTAATASPTERLDGRPYVVGEPVGPKHPAAIGYSTRKLDGHGRPTVVVEPLGPKVGYGNGLPFKKPGGHPSIVVEPLRPKDVVGTGLPAGIPSGRPTVAIDPLRPHDVVGTGLPPILIDGHPAVVAEPLGPNITIATGLPTPILDGPSTVVAEPLGPGTVYGTVLPMEMHRHITAVVEALPHKDKDHKHLALGLAIGVGAGVPAAGLVRWLGTVLKTVSTLAKTSNVYSSVMKALTTFNLDMIPHFNFNPNPKTPAEDVAESVDEWYDELCRQGNTGEQAAEIINNFEADMAKAEAYVANQGASIDEVVGAASGATFSNPTTLQSWSCQAAAQVASTPGSSEKEIADSLLKAGVPADAIPSTAGAVSHAVSNAKGGWIGRPAFNAALGVISSAVSSAGAASVEAAKAAVNGASGPGLAWSLGPAGVPEAAADATAEAVKEAIQEAKASGTDPVIAAINVISNAASPAGLASAAALTGASGSSLAPALSAAGVPTDALGPTADAVAGAISAAGGSASAALSAAAAVIVGASAPKYERLNSPKPPVSGTQAALDVVGASFNFWHIVPWLVWDALNKLDANATDPSDTDDLASLLANGPPPEEWPSRFMTFPYRRGGDRITGLPSLPTDVLRPDPIGTHSLNETLNATQTVTHTLKPTSTLSPIPTSKPTPTLAPAPPGTGGYLQDGTKPTPTLKPTPRHTLHPHGIKIGW